MPEDRDDASELSEQLFEAIDAIVKERLKNLDFDKTIIATIIDNSKHLYGCYKVTTDNNLSFIAYADVTGYNVGDRVYIRIPGGDYTKQKVITGRYIQENRKTQVPDIKTETINNLMRTINTLLKNKEIKEEE